MGDMTTLALAMKTVAHSGLFENLMWSLHSCTTFCNDSCDTKARVVGFVALVTDVCLVTVSKFSGPSPLTQGPAVKVISNTVYSLWQEFNLVLDPIDYSGFTLRNKIILAAVEQQVKQRLEKEPGFPGWKN
jgi:hypothetical protein